MIWNVARIVMAVLILVATAEQLRLATAAAASVGIDGTTAAWRLLAFFTVQSNLWAAVALLVGAISAFASRARTDSFLVALLLAGATTYMTVTGVVYNVVLRSMGDVGILGGWSNDVHHVIAPLFLVLDLLLAPRRRRLRWRDIPLLIAFPLIWVAVTMICGPFLTSPATGTTPWYPYPFLDPASTPGGYLGVAAWIVGIAIVFAALAALAVGVGRWRTRDASSRAGR